MTDKSDNEVPEAYEDEVDLATVHLHDVQLKRLPTWITWVILALLAALAAVIIPQQIRVIDSTERNRQTSQDIREILHTLDGQNQDLKCFADYTTRFNAANAEVLKVVAKSSRDRGVVSPSDQAILEGVIEDLDVYIEYANRDRIPCDGLTGITEEGLPPETPPTSQGD